MLENKESMGITKCHIHNVRIIKYMDITNNHVKRLYAELRD